MNFPRAGASQDGFGVFDAHSSAGHDPDAACSRRHKLLEVREAVCSLRLPAGSENSHCPGCNDGFQRVIQIRAEIEGSVKGHGERMRVVHQGTGSLAIDVHGIGLIHESEDNSVEADFFR